MMLLALAMATSHALAGLTAVLTPVGQPASPGAEVLFSGTLTNTSSTERLFLNDISVVFDADPQTDTSLASNDFFSNVPGILLPGETYDGPLFRISLSEASAAANYAGTITFVGGADITAGTHLASAALTVLATPVDQWRHQTFGENAGSTAAADASDWDHDGLPNLLEYSLGLDALLATVPAEPVTSLLNDHLIMSFVPIAPDVAYTIESSIDLAQWNTDHVEAVTLVNPTPPDRLAFRFKEAAMLPGRGFLRLCVTRTSSPP